MNRTPNSTPTYTSSEASYRARLLHQAERELHSLIQNSRDARDRSHHTFRSLFHWRRHEQERYLAREEERQRQRERDLLCLRMNHAMRNEWRLDATDETLREVERLTRETGELLREQREEFRRWYPSARRGEGGSQTMAREDYQAPAPRNGDDGGRPPAYRAGTLPPTYEMPEPPPRYDSFGRQ
ncbi:hypothetical protein ACLMJK_001724 [Lecanora helva]